MAAASAITVRAPVPGDGPQLGRVHTRAWRRAYRGLMAPEFLAALDERASGDAWYRRLVARAVAGAEPGVDLLVAESPLAADGSPAAPADADTSPGPIGLPGDDAGSTGPGRSAPLRVVGVAAVGPERGDPDGGRGELWMLNVTPEAWGTGAGARLLQSAVERLEARGFTSAVLWVVAGNRRARRFYEREGWTDEGISRVEEIGGRLVAERRYTRGLTSTPSRN